MEHLVRVDESSGLIKTKSEEDKMSGYAVNMFLHFQAELGEGHNVIDGSNLIKTNYDGDPLEFVDNALCEGEVDVILVGWAKTLSLKGVNDL
jgi:hypothetical protein